MFGQVVIDTFTNKSAKSDKINKEIRRVFWLIFRFCLSSRVTCLADYSFHIQISAHTNMNALGFRGESVV